MSQIPLRKELLLRLLLFSFFYPISLIGLYCPTCDAAKVLIENE
ncbi:Uncharacterised protein [Vibrio cholerae]|nr:hypothetical protein VCHC61A1_0786 [Vibrio cholerae HC-61A1]ELT26866.1 hypothetical protein VCHC7A1_01007 [Vibrio cholerae HC-7A1]KKP14655.1 hypothetical protein VS84_00996 [Vibrio cholerae]KKP21319.1 hypothetical protein VS86_00879 [Vibrio cholerae]CRZ79119.1 Uncharacterised protein [Vibrio cholerae]